MELAVISNFHPRRPHRRGSNTGHFHPKLNAFNHSATYLQQDLREKTYLNPEARLMSVLYCSGSSIKRRDFK